MKLKKLNILLGVKYHLSNLMLYACPEDYETKEEVVVKMSQPCLLVRLAVAYATGKPVR